MFDNYVRAFFKKNGITQPDTMLMTTFVEVMTEELKIPKWIADCNRDILTKVLDRAAEKANQAPKSKATKASTSTAGELPLTVKPSTGGN
jgi:hypothetical protein